MSTVISMGRSLKKNVLLREVILYKNANFILILLLLTILRIIIKDMMLMWILTKIIHKMLCNNIKNTVVKTINLFVIIIYYYELKFK